MRRVALAANKISIDRIYKKADKDILCKSVETQDSLTYGMEHLIL